MEEYLAIKRNEILQHATTQMSPENIVLGERSQSQRPHGYSFNEMSKTGKFIKIKSI